MASRPLDRHDLRAQMRHPRGRRLPAAASVRSRLRAPGAPDDGPAHRAPEAHVALVGAGPGDPELLTIRAWRLLQAADVVLHDALVDDRVLELASPHAELVHVGKRAGGHGWKQPEITARLLAEARTGRRVVRLKGGDPFVFGRGGEEALALAEAGIAVEVVPGVTSAVAAPSSAGIPVTHRGVSTHFTVVTGHSADDPELLASRWVHLARAGGTLVFLMPTRNLARIVAALREAGVPDARPAALVSCGTRADQAVLEATVGTLLDAVERSPRVITPATLVVGEVVGLRGQLLGLAAGAHGTTQNTHLDGLAASPL